MDKLVVGLGNPGKKYEKNRHSIGRRIVLEFAKKHELKWEEKKSFLGDVAYGKYLENNFYLLLPLTYMNESGLSLEKFLKKISIHVSNMLFVYDDADIDFNKLLFRHGGSLGGHKGLVSIEKALLTKDFDRLRVGIGRGESDLTEFVLENFSFEEERELLSLIQEATSGIEMWLDGGIVKAQNAINVRKKNKKKEKENEQ